MKSNNYFVYEHITPDGMYYFGVTTNIKVRWKGNGVYYKNTSLEPYIEKYGWENIQHIVLFSNQSKEDALKIEDFLIITSTEDNNCINKHRSGYVSKEDGYYQQYYKQYHQQHREERNKYQREYYQQYREEHREEFRTYMRNYMRNWYHRKKQNKQLKELGYIPLF